MHRYIFASIVVFERKEEEEEGEEEKKSGSCTSLYIYDSIWKKDFGASRAQFLNWVALFQYAHDIRENNGFGTIGMVVIYLFFFIFFLFFYFYKT